MIPKNRSAVFFGCPCIIHTHTHTRPCVDSCPTFVATIPTGSYLALFFLLSLSLFYFSDTDIGPYGHSTYGLQSCNSSDQPNYTFDLCLLTGCLLAACSIIVCTLTFTLTVINPFYSDERLSIVHFNAVADSVPFINCSVRFVFACLWQRIGPHRKFSLSLSLIRTTICHLIELSNSLRLCMHNMCACTYPFSFWHLIAV